MNNKEVSDTESNLNSQPTTSGMRNPKKREATILKKRKVGYMDVDDKEDLEPEKKSKKTKSSRDFFP